MAAMLDFTNGRINFAYHPSVLSQLWWLGTVQAGGLTPVTIPENATAEEIANLGGLNYRALQLPVEYTIPATDIPDDVQPENRKQWAIDNGTRHISPDLQILVRSDSHVVLGNFTNRYKPRDPFTVATTTIKALQEHGFTIGTIGALDEGRRYFIQSLTGERAKIGGMDEATGSILVYDSFDGTLATTAMNASTQTVCNNTLTVNVQDKTSRKQKYKHSGALPLDAMIASLGIGAFDQYCEAAERMTERKLNDKERMAFFLKVFKNLTPAEFMNLDAKSQKSADDLLAQVDLYNIKGPGQNLSCRQNTVWGALNAVTGYIDNASRAHSDDNRVTKSLMGDGATTKQEAYELAYAMV